MIAAVCVIQKSIKEREKALEGFESVYKRIKETLIGTSASIDAVSLEIYELKRALEVIKNA